MAPAKIDPSKPIVAQVGALGTDYVEWTHQPVGGRPRLFGPDWMEFFSKTPWFAVPLIWVPIALAALAYSYAPFGHAMPIAAIAWRAISGVVAWQVRMRDPVVICGVSIWHADDELWHCTGMCADATPVHLWRGEVDAQE